jgi:hypothetical protein
VDILVRSNVRIPKPGYGIYPNLWKVPGLLRTRSPMPPHFICIPEGWPNVSISTLGKYTTTVESGRDNANEQDDDENDHRDDDYHGRPVEGEVVNDRVRSNGTAKLVTEVADEVGEVGDLEEAGG